jgi:hypothetical protein
MRGWAHASSRQGLHIQPRLVHTCTSRPSLLGPRRPTLCHTRSHRTGVGRTCSSTCTHWQRLFTLVKGVQQGQQLLRGPYKLSTGRPGAFITLQAHRLSYTHRQRASELKHASTTFPKHSRLHHRQSRMYSTPRPQAWSRSHKSPQLISHALHRGTLVSRQHWPRARARAPTRHTRHTLVGNKPR